MREGYIFKKKDALCPEGNLKITIPHWDASWHELSNKFFIFLDECGFVFPENKKGKKAIGFKLRYEGDEEYK